MFYPDESNASVNFEKFQMSEYTLENEATFCAESEMMKKIQELDFSIIDLNLFLDTHPSCKEALELFTKLCATSKSLKKDFQKKFYPLYSENSSDNLPFEWVNKCIKWPWE